MAEEQIAGWKPTQEAFLESSVIVFVVNEDWLDSIPCNQEFEALIRRKKNYRWVGGHILQSWLIWAVLLADVAAASNVHIVGCVVGGVHALTCSNCHHHVTVLSLYRKICEVLKLIRSA